MEARTTAYSALKRSMRSSLAATAFEYAARSPASRSGRSGICRTDAAKFCLRRFMRGTKKPRESKSASGSDFTRAVSMLHLEESCWISRRRDRVVRYWASAPPPPPSA